VVRARTNNPQQGWRMTVASIADDLGCSVRSVQRSLRWLEQEGYLHRQRRGLGPGCRVVEAGLGARELEAVYFAPQKPLPPDERRCLAPRTSLRLEDCPDLRRSPRCLVVSARDVSCHVVSTRDMTRVDMCDDYSIIDLCPGETPEIIEIVPRAVATVEKSPEAAPAGPELIRSGVSGESPPPQESYEEEFPSVVSPPGRPERKVEISSSSPTPIASAGSTDNPLGGGAESALGEVDFGLGEASTVLASGCQSRCRRRAVTVEMVDLLTEATLAAEETDPHSGWLYRCRQPDDRLVLAARDLLRDQRRAGGYGGTLCQRTIRRGLTRVWRLCDHLPAARVQLGPACLGGAR
jgi:hypothetical protein